MLKMSNWSEVNDLSNYFKKLQEDTLVNRLSDNNCIEILEKLIKTNKITLLYTTDGKEFVTPKYLIKEIKEELISSGGRINIVDLATILKVDLSHIQNAVNDLLKQDSSLIFILGQLINKNYENIILDEINLKLINYGILALNDLARLYDLPGDYVINILKKGLSTKKIAGILDGEGKRLYTEKYVENQRAKIRGIFSAIISPVNLGQIVAEHKLNENLITPILEQLIKDDQISGVMVGNKRDKLLSFMKYIPHIYTQLQKTWTVNFLNQNKYLEYDSLRKINISDPKTYVTKVWSSFAETEPLAFLQTCCIERSLKNDLISSIDSSLVSQGYVDVMDVVPSYMNPEDGAQLFSAYVEDHRTPQPYKCLDDGTFLWDESSALVKPTSTGPSDKHVLLLLLDSTFVLTRKLINDCRALFEPIVKEKAKEASPRKGYPQILFAEEAERREKGVKHENRGEAGDDNGPSNKRDDRRKKALASGAKGGGTQGRETKTKALTPAHKKAGFGADKKNTNSKSSNNSTQNDEMTDPLPISEITSMLDQRNLGLDEFSVGDEWRKEKVIAEIAEIIHRPLQQMYVEECKKSYMASLSCKRNENKQEFEKTQDAINALYQRLLTFQKGLNLFKDEKVREDLTKYLMRTLGVELFALIVNLQHMQNQDDTRNAVTSQSLATQDGRKIAISKFQENLKSYMSNLNTLLSHNDVSEFLNEITSGSQTGIINVLIKKYDKKKEKVVIQNFRRELVEKIEDLTTSDEDTPHGLRVLESMALQFHSLVTLLFLDQTKWALHASGKFVPNIVDYLIAHPSTSAADTIPQHVPLKDTLLQCQKLIIELYGNQHAGGETHLTNGENEEILEKSAKQKLLAEKLDALQGFCMTNGTAIKSISNDVTNQAD